MGEREQGSEGQVAQGCMPPFVRGGDGQNITQCNASTHWNWSKASPLYVMEPFMLSPSWPSDTRPPSALSRVVLPLLGGPSSSVKRPWRVQEWQV